MEVFNGGIDDNPDDFISKEFDIIHHCLEDGFMWIRLSRVLSTYDAKAWRRMFVHSSLLMLKLDRLIASIFSRINFLHVSFSHG